MAGWGDLGGIQGCDIYHLGNPERCEVSSSAGAMPVTRVLSWRAREPR